MPCLPHYVTLSTSTRSISEAFIILHIQLAKKLPSADFYMSSPAKFPSCSPSLATSLSSVTTALAHQPQTFPLLRQSRARSLPFAQSIVRAQPGVSSYCRSDHLLTQPHRVCASPWKGLRTCPKHLFLALSIPLERAARPCLCSRITSNRSLPFQQLRHS